MTSRARHTASFGLVALVVVSLISAGLAPAVSWQLAGLAIAVAIVGLPHGALDPLVARAAGLVRGIGSMTVFVTTYTVVAAAVVVLWLAFPGLSLTVFLVISAYHFGGDWPLLSRVGRAAAGVTVIAAPAALHPDDVADLFAALADDRAADAIVRVLTIALVPILLTLGAAMASAVRRHGRRMGLDTIELLSVVALAAVASPLVFFGVYFCGLHSPRHLMGAVADISLPRRTVAGVGAGLSVVSVAVGLVVLLLVPAPPVDPDTELVRVLFVGLAALTVPHMVVVGLAERRSGRQVAAPEQALAVR